MSERIEIAAGAEERHDLGPGVVVRRGRFQCEGVANLPAHSFPPKQELTTEVTGEGRELDSHVSQNRRDGGPPQHSELSQEPELFRNSELIESENPNCEVEDLSESELSWEEERERTVYRARTVKMLRRYMRYSIETGRLPSLLGREFFRTEVTPYTMVTFEDRVIFVHDMENCLNKLDEFSWVILVCHIL